MAHLQADYFSNLLDSLCMRSKRFELTISMTANNEESNQFEESSLSEGAPGPDDGVSNFVKTSRSMGAKTESVFIIRKGKEYNTITYH